MSFPLALRGYARTQVDAALDALRTQVAEAEQARVAAERRADQAEAALLALETETEAELRLRAEEAEQALVAVSEAAQRQAGQTRALAIPRLESETKAAFPAVTLPAALPRPVAVARRSAGPPRLFVGAAVALLGLAGAGLLIAQQDDAPRRTATSLPSPSPSAAPSALSGGTVPQAARVPAPQATLPDGWTTHRSQDGLWTIGLPPGWTARGDGFVSASGLTSMSVRTAVLPQEPGLRELEQYERSFAAAHPAYRRLSASTGPFRGHRAGSWEYVYGSGARQQRGSDLGVIVGERGYWLRVVSRASAWEFVDPLVQGFRSSFVPGR